MLNLQRLFDNIKLFSATMSKAIYLLINANDIDPMLVGTPEDRYLLPIFDVIFNKKTFKKESVRRSILTKSIQANLFPLKQIYYDGLTQDNEQVMRLFEANRKTVEPDVHVLLRLDQSTLDCVQYIVVEKSERIPEFVSSLRQLDTSLQTCKRLKTDKMHRVFKNAVTELDEMRKADNPFEKMVHVMNSIK